MTDDSAPTLPAIPMSTTRPRRGILLAAVILAVSAGLLSSTPEETSFATLQAGTELTMLLRFMSIVKAVMALALVAVTAWRLGYPASSLRAVSYISSAALLSAAPVFIWQMAHVAIGAVAFHFGILLLLGTAWVDRGDLRQSAGRDLLSRAPRPGLERGIREGDVLVAARMSSTPPS
jgi:hypothetical protein